MSNGILVGREVKECVKWVPRWPRGKIKRPGEILVGREIKESAYMRSLKVQFFTGCARQHFIFTAALLKRPMISSLWMICIPLIFGYGWIQRGILLIAG